MSNKRKVQDEFLKLNKAASIGFERMFSDFERALEQNQSFPKYNVIKIGENKFAIELALAGYKIEDLEVQVKEQCLQIKTIKNESPKSTEDKDKEDSLYIHRGIANRSFERIFRLSEHIQVLGANMEDGILTINLEQIIPEEKKAKKIEINKS